MLVKLQVLVTFISQGNVRSGSKLGVALKLLRTDRCVALYPAVGG